MSAAKLRVAVAEDDPAAAYSMKKCLESLGHEVLFVAQSGESLVSQARANPPDLIVTDIRMEQGDGIEAAETVYRETPVPIILVSAFYDEELVRRAEESHVMAYLLKPVEASDLVPAIGLALKRFAQMRALRLEAGELRQALEDRKLIERAKGVVMRMLGIDEDEAFRRMRKYASDQNLRLTELAKMVIDAEEPFRQLRILGKEKSHSRTGQR